jgi:hypothetical protein
MILFANVADAMSMVDAIFERKFLTLFSTMMGNGEESTDKDTVRLSRSMSFIEEEIAKRRATDNWTESKA